MTNSYFCLSGTLNFSFIDTPPHHKFVFVVFRRTPPQKIVLLDIEFLADRFFVCLFVFVGLFFFQLLNMSSFCSLASVISDEKSAINLIEDLLWPPFNLNYLLITNTAILRVRASTHEFCGIHNSVHSKPQ